MENIRALPGVQSSSVYRSSVLLRVDLNVPVINGEVQDATRIERIVPTVDYLVKGGAKVIMMSHFGRPEGKDPKFSLKPLVGVISGVLKTDVTFIEEPITSKISSIIEALPWGSVILLENLRFAEGEESNDPDFARRLASIADTYVNDAFSCSHRKHASIDAITRILPAFGGLNLQEELKYLGNIVSKHPVAAIIGGAKASTKIRVLRNLARKVDYLVLGGGVANTFLMLNGFNVGNSLYDKCLDDAKEVQEEAKKTGCKIILPEDHVVAGSIDGAATVKENKEVNSEDSIFDIGKKTSKVITEVLGGCKTIFWNGPMGVFEKSAFIGGTSDLNRTLVTLKKERGVEVIVGGGESILAMKLLGYSDKDFTYVSTGGGALLHFLSIA